MKVDFSDVWDGIMPVLDTCEFLDTPYFVTGSLASSYAGIARAAPDGDIVVNLSEDDGVPFHGSLVEIAKISLESVQKAIRERSSFDVIDNSTGAKTDVFVLPETPYAAECLSRRILLEVEDLGREFFFCGREDIVLNKLHWYDSVEKGSDLQWQDVQGVLRVQAGRLDMEYLKKWAQELKLTELLEKALSEAQS